MKWEKRGLIFGATGENGWDDNSFLQPTPVLMDDRIRIFGGMRDKFGVSRVGYVDVDKENPKNILNVTKKPVLDIGKDGFFDENGVVPTAILKKDGKLYMYYAGYSLGHKVRMLIFTGLAVSSDNGNTFSRYQTFPVMDRINGEELFRVIHSIFYDDGLYRTYYGAGNYFVQGKKKTLPVYDIRYTSSYDGIRFNDNGRIVIPVPEHHHRVGRPYVFKENGIYKMYYGYGCEAIPYRLTYAESDDATHWKNKDINLNLSSSGWDSQMMAYPAFVRIKDKAFLFYNGNNYGYDGFGYAELTEE